MGASNAAEILAERVRHALKDRPIAARRIFGGVTFMLGGNMLCCVSEKGLMVRVGAAAEADALAKAHAAPCLGAGQPMPGFILVAAPGVATEADLKDWLRRGLVHVEKLPPKPAKQSRRSGSLSGTRRNR